MTYNFLKSDAGAVTVDWVVLTAALVGLGLATMSVVSSGVEDISGDVKSELARNDIIKTEFVPEVRTYAPFNQGMVTAIAGAISSLERETLEEGYANEAAKARAAIDAGNALFAENAMDTMKANQIALANNNFEVPEGSESLDDLYTAYYAAGLDA